MHRISTFNEILNQYVFRAYFGQWIFVTKFIKLSKYFFYLNIVSCVARSKSILNLDSYPQTFMHDRANRKENHRLLETESSAWKVPIRGGELGGPVVFFDETGSEVLILSPLSQFMATNMEVRYVKNSTTSTTFPVLDFGLMGSVEVNWIILLACKKSDKQKRKVLWELFYKVPIYNH